MIIFNNNSSIEIDDINEQFKNLREFFDYFGFSNKYSQFGLEFNNDYVNVTDEMPFYYEKNIFVRNKEYLDLPFAEYYSYDICDSRIIKYPGGKGGDNWDVVCILTDIFKIIETFGINGEKAIGATTILAIINAVNWTLKFLNNPNCFNNLISFSNKNGVRLNTENIKADIQINEDEKKTIENGFAIIQNLEKEKSANKNRGKKYN